MAFIKIQKRLVDGNTGKIINNGSAAIIETTYDKAVAGRSKHAVREKLGTVLYISEDRKEGIFSSPTRGIVGYSSATDSFFDVEKGDPRIDNDTLFPEPEIHTRFGDSYLFIKVCEKTGFLEILRTAFEDDREYERVLAHITHSVVKNGSHADCDDFLEGSFLSGFLTDIPVGSLGSDTQYFTMMAGDKVRLNYFKAFVSYMKKVNPKFGKACYVDSTPLPNEIKDNPFRALCSHGVESCSNQTRLALILDKATGLPVWYNIIPGNLLDLSTLETVIEDVKESLGIKIEELVLDAGYAKESVVEKCCIGNPDGMSMTLRCPARDGYPHDKLGKAIRPLFGNAKYEFDREGHTYFGKQYKEMIFGHEIYAYAYVDKDNAIIHGRDFRENNPKIYAKMTDKEKTWSSSMQYGFFILLSSDNKSPSAKLDDYFGRTEIESVFRSSKEYLDILPLSKWSDVTVRGKILSDIIALTSFLAMRQYICKRLEGKKKEEEKKSRLHTTKLFSSSANLMCIRKNNGVILVETPSRKTRENYAKLGLKAPTSLKMDDFRKDVLRL